MNKVSMIAETVDGQGKLLEGLMDGGHIVVCCSNCKAALVDIWVTRPDEPEEWPLQATCPFCADGSFVTTVKGGFHTGGITTCDAEGRETTSTIVTLRAFRDGILSLQIEKARDNARPVTEKQFRESLGRLSC